MARYHYFLEPPNNGTLLSTGSCIKPLILNGSNLQAIECLFPCACHKLQTIRKTLNISNHHVLWVWARPCHCANPALQLKLSLKKTAKGTICPLQNLGGKTRKEAHTKRFISVQKLQAKQNMESIFYRTFKDHSKFVTFQSRSTETCTSHAQPSVVNAPGNC